MTDINTNNSSNTTIDAKKVEKELKEKEKDKKFAQKVETKRIKQIAKLEAKKAKFESKLNATQNPWRKGVYKKRIESLNEEIKTLKENRIPKHRLNVTMKAWSKGLGKEARRVTWYGKRDIIKDFITVIIVCVFLALIFFGIDMIIVSVR